MSIKLTDTHLGMLHAAAQREDRCLAPLQNLRGAQLAKIGKTLISGGLAREVKAKPSSPVWRRDSETGTAYTLKLTAAGAKAIAVVDERASDGDADGNLDAPLAPAGSGSPAAIEKAGEIAQPPAAASRTPIEPRANSKIAEVVTLLVRPDGATLADLVAATGWLPHTIRAALTGVRKRGYDVAIDRSDRTRGSIYHIGSTRRECDAPAVAVEAA
jgi:hypothetical protein